MPGPVYLGKIQVNWCRNCNLPILEASNCPCGSETFPVPLTPPGDAYPAVGRSLELLREAVDGAYGPSVGPAFLPDDRLVLFNIIPHEDRALEVVLDGSIQGRSFYDPISSAWVFKPTLEGARRLSDLTQRRKVVADPGAVSAILRGGSLLAPGVLGADSLINPGDEVLIQDTDGLVVGVGSARMFGPEMTGKVRGMAVKVREAGAPVETGKVRGGQTWDDAVRANEPVLSARESEATDFIRRVVDSRDMPVSVAFSGGKDSLCTLLLTSKAIRDFSIIFIDTGIEFPETVSYTYKVIQDLGMADRLITRAVGDKFWEAMDVFGPPARDARWCCKVCKLGPTTSVIQEHFGGKCLTFVGQRRYESQQRSSRGRVGRNPWVPGQISASPIRNWTALHVWLYIFREGAEMNPLYYRGYARIGCSVCPASELAELDLLKLTHPAIHERLRHEIGKHAKNGDLPENWTELALWRWRRSPGWAGELEAPERFNYVKPVVLKAFREPNVELTLRADLDERFEMRRISNALMALGHAVVEDGDLSVDHPGATITISDGARLSIGPGEEATVRDVGRRAASCLVKAAYCVGCGTCAGSCHRGAISVSGGRAWIGDECVHCGSCIELCPLLTWAVKEPARPFG